MATNDLTARNATGELNPEFVRAVRNAIRAHGREWATQASIGYEQPVYNLAPSVRDMIEALDLLLKQGTIRENPHRNGEYKIIGTGQ